MSCIKEFKNCVNNESKVKEKLKKKLLKHNVQPLYSSRNNFNVETYYMFSCVRFYFPKYCT